MDSRAMRNYIICATARSGSNWLCELLASTGVAGRPEEHLWDPPGSLPDPLARRWPCVLQAGTGSNGVFGLKLLPYQAERLERELPDIAGMAGAPLSAVWRVTLGDPAYIALTRQDHLRQAISFLRAIQTEQWRSMDRPMRSPEYDAEALSRALDFVRGEEAWWEEFYTRHGHQPNRITYEAIEADPTAAVTSLLQHLGFDGRKAIYLPPSRHQRQADSLTDDWVRRYRDGRGR
jgi:LPS sulfotransferase NodH